jgi:hypothetical protein
MEVKTYNRLMEFALAGEEAEKDLRRNIDKLVWAKYSFGEWMLENDLDTGDMAQRLKIDGVSGWDRSEINRSMKFARDYSEEKVREVLHQQYSWWGIKTKLLPSPKERIENSLDKSLMGHDEIRRAIPDMDQDQKDQAAGHLLTEIGDAGDILSALGHPVEVGYPQNNVDKSSVSDFAAWVRLQSCIVCGKEGDLHAHHYPKTKGSGGADDRVIPLCGVCHVEAHQMGVKSWSDLYWREVLEFLQFNLVRALVE